MQRAMGLQRCAAGLSGLEAKMRLHGYLHDP
jgi:hypothetical protein